jgi:hypothetical protein
MNYQQPDYQQPQQPPYPDQSYQQPQYQQPYQQPMQPTRPPKKKLSKRGVIIAAVIGIIIAVIAANAGNHGGTPNTATSSTPGSASTGNSTNAPTQPPANQHFKVGDTVTVGSTWKAVVNGVSTDGGNDFSVPKDGHTYLIIDVSLTNLSNKEQNISSLLNFTLKDSTGQKYDESIDSNAGATLDGKVEAGGPLRGVIAYEVPANIKSFILAFAPDLMSSGQTIWDLSL